MGFEVIEQDIAKFSGDAIVSSFGLLKNKPGCLAYDIQKAAGINAKAVNDEICQNLVLGRVYATSGFDLPVKKILHIGTPCFDNDRRLEQLQDAYLACLLYCKRFQLYKIALPIIGTGKSHYPHALVLAMVVPMVSKFTELYPEFDITVAVTPNNTQSDIAWADNDDVKESVAKFFSQYRSYPKTTFYFKESDFELARLSFHHGSKYETVSLIKHARPQGYNLFSFNYANSMSFCCLKTANDGDGNDCEEVRFAKRKRAETIVDLSSLKLISITDYITAFVDICYSNLADRKLAWSRIREYVGGDKTSTSFKTKHSDPAKIETTSKAVLMRYCLALKMSLDEAVAFFNFCGKSFSPALKSDQVYKEILLKREYDDYQANGLCYQLGIEPIFAFSNKE